MRIGIAGTGRMGSAMARRLMGRGAQVVVWNRTRARAQLLLEQGAGWADTPAELSAGADVVLTMLLDEAALEEVYFSPEGLLAQDPARVVDILADTSGGPNMLKARGPMIARALSGDASGGVTVNVATMRKDMRMMLQQAQQTHCELPLTSLALATFEQAAQQGLDEADCTQLPVWWLHQSGRA